MAKRLSNETNEWVSEEIDLQAQGDDIEWDTTVFFDQSGAKIALIMMMPSLILGEKIQNINWITFPVTREHVEQWVRISLEAMRDKRSTMATLGNGSGS